MVSFYREYVIPSKEISTNQNTIGHNEPRGIEKYLARARSKNLLTTSFEPGQVLDAQKQRIHNIIDKFFKNPERLSQIVANFDEFSEDEQGLQKGQSNVAAINKQFPRPHLALYNDMSKQLTSILKDELRLTFSFFPEKRQTFNDALDTSVRLAIARELPELFLQTSRISTSYIGNLMSHA